MAQMYIPGMALGYREWGPTQKGAATVIFLHDLGQSGLIWRPLATRLAELGIHSYALDLPAHGESAACPWGYSLPALRPVLEAFRAGMGEGCPLWIATGYSTKVLLDYAAYHAEQVRGAVLIEPVDHGATPVWRRLPAYWAMQRWQQTAGPFYRADEMFAAARLGRPYRAAWDGPSTGWPEPGRHPVAHAFFATMQQGPEGDWRARLSPEVYRRYMEALLASDLGARLPGVRAPVLLAARAGNRGGVVGALTRLLSQVEAIQFRREEEPTVSPSAFVAALHSWIEQRATAMWATPT